MGEGGDGDGAQDDTRRPPAREQIQVFLRQRPGEGWCAECAASALLLLRPRVANVYLALEGLTGFRRADTACVCCRRRRLTLVYLGQSTARRLADAEAADA